MMLEENNHIYYLYILSQLPAACYAFGSSTRRRSLETTGEEHMTGYVLGVYRTCYIYLLYVHDGIHFRRQSDLSTVVENVR